MANDNIGVIECPSCNEDAYVRESKKGWAYVVCVECGYQGFSRSDYADNKIRSKMRPVNEGPDPKKTEPAPEPKPEPKLEPKKAEEKDDDWGI